MTLFPATLAGRIAALSWLCACVAVLAFAFNGRAIHDTDEAFLYLMLALTIPSGFSVAAILAGLLWLLDKGGVVVPGGFVTNLLLWVPFVVVGYFQWFLLVPWASRKWKPKVI